MQIDYRFLRAPRFVLVESSSQRRKGTIHSSRYSDGPREFWGVLCHEARTDIILMKISILLPFEWLEACVPTPPHILTLSVVSTPRASPWEYLTCARFGD